MDGNVFAIMGVAIAIVMSGIGSSLGVAAAAQAAAGVVSEDPDKFGKTLVLQLLPSTQGIYGFIVGFLMLFLKILPGVATKEQGLVYLGICIPVGVVGLISAIYQGKVAATAINMVGRRPELSGRGMLMAAFVEMFALLGFIVSIIGVIML